MDTTPSVEKQAMLASKQHLLEVPFLDYLVANLYRLFGSENLIIPRLLSIMFWMIAGAILYCLGRDLVSHDAAIISLAFFFFLPYGVRASRSFQPDPLMVMMFVAAIFSIFKHFTRSSVYSLAIVSVLSALAILVKPVCIFPIFGAFIAMKFATRGANKLPVDRELILFTFLSFFPSALYYGYGIFIAGFLEQQAQSSFKPILYLEPAYWKGWFKMVVNYVGAWPVAISIIGVLLIRSELKRSFLIGLWVGYGIFGLVFSYHIYTHDYYHLMLIPIVSLSLGVAASLLLTQMSFDNGLWERISRITIWGILIFSIFWSLRISISWLDDLGFDSQIAKYEEIGEHVNYSSNTIFLDSYYGDPLKYYGKIAGTHWYTSDDIQSPGSDKKPSEKQLINVVREKSPEYFIVSSMDELEAQEYLKNALDSRYPILIENTDYIIYDMRGQSE